MWNEIDFNAIKFIGIGIPFPEDFPNNYKIVYNKPFLKLSNLNENHMMRVLLMKRANRENVTTCIIHMMNNTIQVLIVGTDTT